VSDKDVVQILQQQFVHTERTSKPTFLAFTV